MGILELQIDGIDSNNRKYNTNELEEFFLQLKIIDYDTNKNIYDMEELTITNSENNIYYQNLKYFTKLKKLKITDSKLFNLPIEITELTNLTELSLNPIRLHKNNQSQLQNINGISKLTNLKKISINMTCKIFPLEILELKKIQRLSLNTNSEIKIPNEICELEDLFAISINCPPFYLMDGFFIEFANKAIIKSWRCYTKSYITEKITDLKILYCDFDELVDLPSHIEILRLGTKVKDLPNLPIGLQKLYLYNDLPYFKEKNIKLPFGCELILV
jgi:hypothetical protein